MSRRTDTLSILLSSVNLQLLSQIFSSEHPAATHKKIASLLKDALHIDIFRLTKEDLTPELIASLDKFEDDYFTLLLTTVVQDYQQQNQLAALGSSKMTINAKYVFWLGAAIIFAGIFYIVATTWIPIPDTNKTLASTNSNIFICTVLVTLVNFFFAIRSSLSERQENSVSHSNQSDTQNRYDTESYKNESNDEESECTEYDTEKSDTTASKSSSK